MENQKRYRTFLLLLVYFIMMMWGISSSISTPGMMQEREFFYSLALALVLTQACIVDSQIVGKPLSIFSYWLVFMLCGIAVPVCIVRARGLRGLAYVAAHFVGLELVLIISFIVAGIVFAII